MQERFLTRSAVMLMLLKTENGVTEILLQKRKNTGYADNMWDYAATGHVDADESMKMAVIREAYEELGIRINMGDVRFATMTHKYTRETNNIYYNAFFVATGYEGVPFVKEPHKCSEIKWFPIDQLPDDLLPDRKDAIHNYLHGISYSEFGWRYLE